MNSDNSQVTPDLVRDWYFAKIKKNYVVVDSQSNVTPGTLVGLESEAVRIAVGLKLAESSARDTSKADTELAQLKLLLVLSAFIALVCAITCATLIG